MAKGRKLITSRSELLLGSYGYGGNTIQDENGGEELGEDDVWSMVDGMANQSDHDWNISDTRETNMRRRYHNPAHRGGGAATGGLSSALVDLPPVNIVSSPRIVHHFLTGDGFANPQGRQVAASAPVNVPDWSKIYRVDSVESIHDSGDIIDDQDFDMVPPHEYLARAYARSRGESAANSVCVGAGRTLKGRDLSRVRDAVWSHTGFNG